MEKILDGVLRVITPLGPRYLKPSFPQRLYLLWLFRNFPTLPVKVLSPRQQKRIEAMYAQHGFVSVASGLLDPPVLGTLEQRPPVEAQGLPRRMPEGGVSQGVGNFAADQQRS